MSVSRALVVGASGFLGRRLLAALGERGVGTYRGAAFPGGLAFDASTMRIGDVIGAAGGSFTHAFIPYGSIDMEGCARDPAGTSQVNVVSTIRLIQDLFALRVTPVFFSTDYVFSGKKALWREEDPARPRMAYGAQKLAVEAWLGTRSEDWLIIRLSKLVSGGLQEHGQLGQWAADLKAGKAQNCAADQFYSPALVDDVAGAALALTETGATGLYHLAGPQRFSRYDLLTLLAEEIERVRPGVLPPIRPARLHDMPFLEKRPLDTSLSIEKLRERVAWRFTPMQELCARIAADQFA